MLCNDKNAVIPVESGPAIQKCLAASGINMDSRFPSGIGNQYHGNDVIGKFSKGSYVSIYQKMAKGAINIRERTRKFAFYALRKLR